MEVGTSSGRVPSKGCGGHRGGTGVDVTAELTQLIEECFQPVRRVKAVRRRRFGPGLSRPFTKHLRPADVTDPTAGEPGHQFTIRQCLNHPIGCSRRRTGQAHQGSDRQRRREIGKRSHNAS